MVKAKIAVNGYGTIGKRVADAVQAQDDMEVIGISKTKPNYEAAVAHQLGYDIYAPAENVGAFEKAGMPAAGTIEEMVEKADLVVDCTPGGVGEGNKPLYEKAGVKAIWQGGESHPLAGFSFNAVSNYEEAVGRDLVRVVSCNTTGLCRAISPIDRELGVKKVRVILARRAADPNDVKKGPINAIVPDPIKLPSHHGPDVKSVLPHINITTAALKIPTTLMHVHTVNMEVNTDCTAEDIKKIFGSQSENSFRRAGYVVNSRNYRICAGHRAPQKRYVGELHLARIHNSKRKGTLLLPGYPSGIDCSSGKCGRYKGHDGTGKRRCKVN